MKRTFTNSDLYQLRPLLTYMQTDVDLKKHQIHITIMLSFYASVSAFSDELNIVEIVYTYSNFGMLCEAEV